MIAAHAQKQPHWSFHEVKVHC